VSIVIMFGRWNLLNIRSDQFSTFCAWTCNTDRHTRSCLVSSSKLVFSHPPSDLWPHHTYLYIGMYVVVWPHRDHGWSFSAQFCCPLLLLLVLQSFVTYYKIEHNQPSGKIRRLFTIFVRRFTEPETAVKLQSDSFRE